MKQDVKRIFMTSFAERHFKGKSSVTQIKSMSSIGFTEKVNEALRSYFEDEFSEGVKDVLPGMFPDFSRVIRISNFTDAKTTVMPITIENAQYLRTDYSARVEGELPVMSRWLELPPMIKTPIAKNLSVVLYSREQLLSELFERPEDENVPKIFLENFINQVGFDNIINSIDTINSLNKQKHEHISKQNYDDAAVLRYEEKEIIKSIRLDELPDGMSNQILEMTAPWGIVAIMAHDGEHPEPMNPITMMRNALGKEEGGNGVPLDKNLYEKSVEFWRTHANVK